MPKPVITGQGVTECLCSLKRKRGAGGRGGYNHRRHTFGDLLSQPDPTSRFQPTLKTAPPAGDQGLSTEQEGLSHVTYNTGRDLSSLAAAWVTVFFRHDSRDSFLSNAELTLSPEEAARRPGSRESQRHCLGQLRARQAGRGHCECTALLSQVASLENHRFPESPWAWILTRTAATNSRCTC